MSAGAIGTVQTLKLSGIGPQPSFAPATAFRS